MSADPRWLEILKASSGQSAAVAVACGAFLLFNRWGWFPGLPAWVFPAVVFGFVLSIALFIASAFSAAYKIFPVDRWIVHAFNIRRDKNAARDYIPHMTPKEREIIAWLIAHNQKMFVAAADGGYAATLLSRKIVVRALLPGQVYTYEQTPMSIPDHAWDVLVSHKERFEWDGNIEHPWLDDE